MSTKQLYTCQCMRCGGSGRFDRGACFDCKGAGFVNRASTRGLTPFVLAVTYEKGGTESPRVFATTRGKAVEIVERHLRVKGWAGVVR